MFGAKFGTFYIVVEKFRENWVHYFRNFGVPFKSIPLEVPPVRVEDPVPVANPLGALMHK